MAVLASRIERLGGVTFAAGANRTLALDDPTRFYIVEQGHLDVFAAEFQGDDVMTRRPFAARVPAGSVAFGAPRAVVGNRVFGLLGVPSRNAVIVEARRARLTEGPLDLGLVTWIDEWVGRLSEFLARQAGPVPRGTRLLEADPDMPCEADATLSAHHLDVLWASADQSVRFMGSAELTVEVDQVLPLTERTWVETGDSETRVSAVHTPRALISGILWPSLDHFVTAMLTCSAAARREDAQAIRERHEGVREAHRSANQTMQHELASVLGVGDNPDSVAPDSRAPVEAVMQLLVESIGDSIPLRQAQEDAADPLEAYLALVRGSAARARRISLSPEWWKLDGPSFAGVTTNGEPVAVLSDGTGRYRAVDPASGRSFRIGRREAAEIATEGVMLYAPFPARIRNVAAALRHAVGTVVADVRSVLFMSVLSSLVGLATPILTGNLLATVIPRSDTPMLIAGLAGLALCALGNAVFQVVQTFALVRIEGRLDERLQSAIWSRVLTLPVGFFRQYAAGDLADRMGGLPTIRSMLSGAVVQSIVGGLFSLTSIGLLFFYSMRLAVVAGGLVLTLVSVSLMLGRLQMQQHRKALNTQGVIDGLLFQVITGLAKLRVANAEPYVLARWVGLFAKQQSATLKARRWAAAQLAFNGLFTPLASAVLLGVIWMFLIASESSSFGLAAFLIAFTAFGQLAGGMTGLIGAATTAIALVPLFERVKPLLEAEPEITEARTDPGDLTGDIEIRDVHFRYTPDSECVLRGVSLRIRPGDYVAIVGPSGAGKSTIYRLLCGFERPDSGAVLFDGHDLLNLDPECVRRHLGVVLQDGQVVADTILNNVAGSSRLSTEEVWEAVRGAGLEEDIRTMPMGLHTMLHEGGGGLSGGQRQRLLIARSLARKPRILLLDEATSALDNRVQSVVRDTLGKLSITRIVIAHRLSTVRDVDRIYVLDGGRIAESGRYDDLIVRDGLFAELAKRQLL